MCRKSVIVYGLFDAVSAFFTRYNSFDMIFICGFTNVSAVAYEIYFRKLGLMMTASVVRVPGYRSRGPGFDSRRC
jgi:hypothetical protein